MRMGGFQLEPWDVWDEYAKRSPGMVRHELWKARFRGIGLGWSRRELAVMLARLAFVLQKQVPSHQRMTKEEMSRLLNF